MSFIYIVVYIFKKTASVLLNQKAELQIERHKYYSAVSDVNITFHSKVKTGSGTKYRSSALSMVYSTGSDYDGQAELICVFTEVFIR